MENKSLKRIWVCIKKSYMYRKIKSLLKWLKNWHDALEIILITITIIVATWLFKTTQEQVEQAKVANQRTKDALRHQVFSDSLNRTIMKDTEIRQLRAYLNIKLIKSGNIDLPNFLEEKIRVVNYGQTPAKKVQLFCMIKTLPSKFTSIDYYISQFPYKVSNYTISFPGEDDNTEFARVKSEEKFDERIINKLFKTEGDSSIFLFGKIIYRDIFDIERHTKFCFTLVTKIIISKTGDIGIPIEWQRTEDHNDFD